jgi:hypothetical protein
MDSWANEKFSPKPVHGRERRKEAVNEEEGTSFKVKERSSSGVVYWTCKQRAFHG